jgi:hypothetical protein
MLPNKVLPTTVDLTCWVTQPLSENLFRMFTLKTLFFRSIRKSLHQLPFVYVPIYVLDEISSSVIIVNDYNRFVKAFLQEKPIKRSIIQNLVLLNRMLDMKI